MKKLVAAVLTALVAGCSVAPVAVPNIPPAAPQDGLLALCNGIPVPSVGVDNESLARAFLAARAGLLTCQGVTQGLQDAKSVGKANGS